MLTTCKQLVMCIEFVGGDCVEVKYVCFVVFCYFEGNYFAILCFFWGIIILCCFCVLLLLR
jgi:hypothetical protein